MRRRTRPSGPRPTGAGPTPAPVPGPWAPPALEVRGLDVRLGGTCVLHDVDLDVRAGEWLGVIGPNGAGKSTLLRALGGVLPHAGRVRARGGEPRRTELALMPQSPLLPPGMSVVEYVLLGRTGHLGWLGRESGRDRQAVVDVLRRLDLTDFAARLVTDLSGGEAQRVVVARALAQAAPVLLLDEPTSALDVGHQVEVLELVDELRRDDGLTVLAAMHDLDAAARYADRLLLLDRGRTVALDEPAVVIEADTLSRVYGTPLEVHRLRGDLVVLPAPRTPPPTTEQRRTTL